MRFLVTEKLGPHKFKTPEGYLICTDAILSRTGKQEYKRCELFGDACEDPDKIVNVERTDDEVFSDKAMASFENKPVCIEHPDHDVNAENHNELAVGFVRDIHKGEDNGKPVMMGTLVITDKDAVEAVESGEYKELSCGYDCDIDDDDKPCQRNIRGNHVALCKQGRAGIARIVDSVKTTDDNDVKWLIALDRHNVRYSFINGGYGMKFSSDADYNLAKKLAIQCGVKKGHWYDNKLEYFNFSSTMISNDAIYNVPAGSQITTQICDEGDGVKGMRDIQVTKTPGTDKIIYVMQSDIDKNLYFYIGKTFSMKEGNWGYTKFEMGDDTPEKIKAELARNGWHQVANGPAKVIDASNEEWTVVEEENYKKANKPIIDEEYVQLPRGRFKVVEKTKEELEEEGYGYHHSANGYSVYTKNNTAIAIKDTVCANDANHEQWTKQGWRVAALYKDGGRIHAIVERKSGDFVVALGYNTSTGEWAQGRYVSTFGAAVDTLNEEKPGAIPIRDAKPIKKLFEVSFVKDGVTYIRKVRANDLQDAIQQVKDEHLSPMTYKKLKELGVSQRQWSGWSQEQANEYIRKHSSNRSEEKSTEKAVQNKASSMKSLAKTIESSHKKEDVEKYESELQKYLPDKSKINSYDDAKKALHGMLKKMGFEEGKDYVINEKVKMVGHGTKYPSVDALVLKAKSSSPLSDSYISSMTESALSNIFKLKHSSTNNSGWTYTFDLDL